MDSDNTEIEKDILALEESLDDEETIKSDSPVENPPNKSAFEDYVETYESNDTADKPDADTEISELEW